MKYFWLCLSCFFLFQFLYVEIPQQSTTFLNQTLGLPKMTFEQIKNELAKIGIFVYPKQVLCIKNRRDEKTGEIYKVICIGDRELCVGRDFQIEEANNEIFIIWQTIDGEYFLTKNLKFDQPLLKYIYKLRFYRWEGNLFIARQDAQNFLYSLYEITDLSFSNPKISGYDFNQYDGKLYVIVNGKKIYDLANLETPIIYTDSGRLMMDGKFVIIYEKNGCSLYLIEELDAPQKKRQKKDLFDKIYVKRIDGRVYVVAKKYGEWRLYKDGNLQNLPVKIKRTKKELLQYLQQDDYVLNFEKYELGHLLEYPDVSKWKRCILLSYLFLNNTDRLRYISNVFNLYSLNRYVRDNFCTVIVQKYLVNMPFEVLRSYQEKHWKTIELIELFYNKKILSAK